MDDRQMAIEALEKAGYECVYGIVKKGESGYISDYPIFAKGRVQVRCDHIRQEAKFFVPYADLPALLSPLTVEMVLSAFREAGAAEVERTAIPHKDKVAMALATVLTDAARRLRQQIEHGGAGA